MLRVVVIGRGLRGLVASWVLRQHPAVEVVTIGTARSSCSAASGLDEVPPNTHSLRSLLQALSVAHSVFRPRLGVLRGGQVRGGRNSRGSSRLRFSAVELEQELRGGVWPYPASPWRAEPGWVRLNGSGLGYDFLLLTEPPASCRPHVWFSLPTPPPARLHQALVSPAGRSPFLQWDEVLTPETPAKAISRLLSNGASSIIETVGTGAELQRDLAHLYPDGCSLLHLRACTGRSDVVLPENTATIPEALPLSETLDCSYGLLRRWTTDRRKRP